MLSFLWRRRDLGSKILVVDSLYLTNYSPWTVRFRLPVNLGVRWWPGVTGTYRSVITPVVVERSNPNHRWPGVSPGIICYLFTNLGRMDGCVSPAAPEYKKICWYDLHGEPSPGCSYRSTMIYPLCYSRSFTWRFYIRGLKQI